MLDPIVPIRNYEQFNKDKVSLRILSKPMVFIKYKNMYRVEPQHLVELDNLGFLPVISGSELGFNAYYKEMVVDEQYSLETMFKENLYAIEDCPLDFIEEVRPGFIQSRKPTTQTAPDIPGRIQEDIEDISKDFLFKPASEYNVGELARKIEESLERLAKTKQIQEDSKVHTHIETWTTMKDCGKIRGLWNRMLNKFFGHTLSAKRLRWYHLLFGFKIQAHSHINLCPTLILNCSGDPDNFVEQWEELNGMPYDGDGDTLGFGQHVGDLTDNARDNATYFATIQTPQTYIDLEVISIQPVTSIKVDFTVKK